MKQILKRNFISLRIISIILGAVAISACGEQSVTSPATTTTGDASAGAAADIDNPLAWFDRDEVDADLRHHIQVLAADEYEGRAPATRGEELTTAYLEQAFKMLGLWPGNNGSYFQTVPVTEITADSDTALYLNGSDYQRTFAYGPEMIAATQQQIEQVELQNSPLVFVGFGIVAPERNWNDYAGLDVKGKTVVILVNDPGYYTQDPELFNGKAMTYYGRWTYKYEEAARQGAAGALIVHETGAAGYGWEVVQNSWSGAQITLTADNLNRDRCLVEGWLTLDAAKDLFSAAGMDYETLKTAATKPGFAAQPMAGIQASLTLQNTIRQSQSNNVIAWLPGTERPEETLIYTAHWDHLGKNPALAGDQIFNGAEDNASGTAGLLALARQFVEAPIKPERSTVFLAVTAEESGLLGSRWYSENPIFPLADTVANINMDRLNLAGATKDVVVIGYGGSELEDYLKEAADLQGRYLAPEPTPEKGYYYRSDHFNFAKYGVPALYAKSGIDSVERGKAWGEAQAQEYIDKRYHQPADEYDPQWDTAGAIDDLALYFVVGNKLGRESRFPNWYVGNEFRAIRDQSRSDAE